MSEQRINYVPFALREIVSTTQPTGNRAYISLGSMGINRSSRVLIGDLTIILAHYVLVPVDRQFLLMRIGHSGRGYLLTQHIPFNLLTNRGKPNCSVWQFPKPYTLYPGERLRAIMNPAESRTAKYQAIMFNCVRKKDNLPHLLYDTSDAMVTWGTIVPLNGPGLICPADSPIDIYSVTIHEYVPKYDSTGSAINSTAVQIYGPDGREWFKVQDRSAFPTPVLSANQWWLNIPVPYLELGEERGWWLEPGEIFTMDFSIEPGVNIASTVEYVIAATVRGSVEVVS